MPRYWPLRLVTLVAGVLVLVVGADASHLKEHPKKHRIVYQLSDGGVDRARFVLNNIGNHVNGVGWDNIEAIELVVFGPGLRSFVTEGMDPAVERALAALQSKGLTFGACGNTMKNFSITLEQLPKGSKPLPQGGVVRIMELQDAGYTYIRP